ncbi:MAG: dihydrodipicolinate synthase family protein [Brevinema sp.]
MSQYNKYRGVFPAFYACYDDQGNISRERIHDLVNFFFEKGVKGIYVGGSSGECIYQTLEERKLALEAVMEVAKGKMTVIAHIGCPNTRDSVMLAHHAKSCGVDALSSIPPIYFVLSDDSVEDFWTEMATATDLDFFIYNIPQTTNYNLSSQVYKNLLKLPQVIGVKNSSGSVLDIMKRKIEATKPVIIFNGPDEQYIAGRIMGADGGIGGTYGVMPELYLKLEELYTKGDLATAQELQMLLNVIIMDLFSCKAHMYSVIKAILILRGVNIGKGRLPLHDVVPEDRPKIEEIYKKIESAVQKYCRG